jgi:hypothetical protein
MRDEPENSSTPGNERSVPEAIELPGRWSVCNGRETRTSRSAATNAVSRESQVHANGLESWKRIFLNHGRVDFRVAVSMNRLVAAASFRNRSVFGESCRKLDDIVTKA